MHRRKLFLWSLVISAVTSCATLAQESGRLLDEVQHGYAQNGDVKIHFVSIGQGPLVVMLHGFPDYWYTWRDQMQVLKEDFQVVAVDLRGYNLSDQPEGVEPYAMQHLMEDVVAVIKAQGKESATIVGHDWGGAIAWQLAINQPEVVERLIVCNMTHPVGRSKASLATLQANNNESYMDTFRQHTSETLPVSWLCGWVKDAEARKQYEAAFRRSNVDCMINYYKANTQTRQQRAEWLKDPKMPEPPKTEMPVLAIFGTQDKYVDKKGLNDTWDWMSKDLTLVTIPDAAHFVQQDAPDLVSKSMKMWLMRDDDRSPAGLDESMADFQWLTGQWERETRRGAVFEEWSITGPTTLSGTGFSIDSKTGERVVSEEILLTRMGEDFFYIPKVKGNSLPVAFRLVSSSSDHLVFENPEHDFPQRIEYKRTSEGGLHATISDMARSKEIPFQFLKK